MQSVIMWWASSACRDCALRSKYGHASARVSTRIGSTRVEWFSLADRRRSRLVSLVMSDTEMLAAVAGLVGEPARTRMVTALLTGRALTAKELACVAGVTAATASSHLSRLVAGDLIAMERQGRCHYYRLKSAEVARAIEGLMTVATAPANEWSAGPPRRARAAARPGCATTTSRAGWASRCAT